MAASKGPPGLAALFAGGPPGKGRGAAAAKGPSGAGGLGDLFAGSSERFHGN